MREWLKASGVVVIHDSFDVHLLGWASVDATRETPTCRFLAP
jgi:hypothetical protein